MAKTKASSASLAAHASAPINQKLTAADKVNLYRQMVRIRRFEQVSLQHYQAGRMGGFLHLYIGQESVAVGTVSVMGPNDHVITAYRDHGLAIAKGISCDAAMAELFGKVTGCSKGKGGSMHFFSKQHYFFGGHGIVGAQIPLGAGIGFAEQYKGTGNVCLCYFGDGAVRQGAVHETFNMAMLWKIPVVFICENNGYAMGTSLERTTNQLDMYKIGLAYDMPSYPVDGMQPETVHAAIYEAVEKARDGEGPTFLEIKTYRYRGHSMSDPATYRTKEEVAEYKKVDPIETTKASILAKGYATEAELDKMEEDIIAEVEASVTFSEDSPYPDASTLFTEVYVENDYPFIKD